MAGSKEVIENVKKEHKKEIENVLGKFVYERPTDENLTAVKDCYNVCLEKIKTELAQVANQRENARALKEIANFFVALSVSSCDSAWKTSVGYNYYRDAFSTLGKAWTHDKRWVETNTNSFRPMKDTWDRFIHETDNLVNLLLFAEKQINDRTDPDAAHKLFIDVAFYEECVAESGSWKIMPGYAGNLDSKKIEGWHEEYSLSNAAKEYRLKFASQYREKAKKIPEKLRSKQVEIQKADKARRITEYWEEHEEEYASLLKEQAEVNIKIQEVKKKIDAMVQEKSPQINHLNKILSQPTQAEQMLSAASAFILDLEDKKKNLKVFEAREKKELQDKIKAEKEKFAELRKDAKLERQRVNKEISAELALHQGEIDSIKAELETLEKRADRIKTELTKER